MIKFRCAGNWKLNKSIAETRNFAKILLAKIEISQQSHFTIYPPALVAGELATELAKSDVIWGGQNCYSQPSGAFTGENSAQTLKEMGASSCLIGHSERRAIFGEADSLLADKVKLVQALDLEAVLCIGETLEQRRAGKVKSVIESQLELGLAGVDWSKSFVVAYEPVWAIGTGEVATPQQVEEAHAFIREFLKHISPKGETTPIWYGGSVKPGNAKELSQIKNVNGFLIGGASLKVDDFVGIYQATL